MRTRRLSLLLAAVSIPLLATAAFAAAGSVSTKPGPQVIIPDRVSSQSPSTSKTSTTASDDNPATHDVGDDHGTDGTTVTTNDDGAGHDVGDDHGTDGTTVTTNDDGAGHDVGDDHGTDGTTVTTLDDRGHDGTTVTTLDDHGDNSGPDDSHSGSDDSSGSGSGGH